MPTVDALGPGILGLVQQPAEPPAAPPVHVRAPGKTLRVAPDVLAHDATAALRVDGGACGDGEPDAEQFAGRYERCGWAFCVGAGRGGCGFVTAGEAGDGLDAHRAGSVAAFCG